jgi:hypothetical protein
MSAKQNSCPEKSNGGLPDPGGVKNKGRKPREWRRPLSSPDYQGGD